MTNSNLFRKEVAVISPTAPIEEAARLMRNYHVGSVVVVETSELGGLFPVGLLTDRDIVVELVADGVDIHKVSVKDIMSPKPITALHTASLDELVQLMQSHRIRRVPIVDDKNHLVGFVSLDDLFEKVGHELATLSQLYRYQQQLEREVRPARPIRLS